MYCPQCGTNNLTGGQFCRSCGANLSLVPKALSGELAQGSRAGAEANKKKSAASHGYGVRKIFAGLGFIVVALILMGSKAGWGIWLLIPGFIALGKGIAATIEAKYGQRPSSPTATLPPPPARSEMRPQEDFDNLRVGSVTEGTTRKLEGKPPSGISQP